MTALDPLPSWRDGVAKAAIVEFVDLVTTSGSARFVRPSDRIAAFDNDGTLWCEQPAYAQAFFIIERLREMAEADPELAERPVVHALLAGDLATAMQHGIGAVADVLLRSHAGMTAEEFSDTATRWLESAVHPRFGVPFRRLAYRPMVEVLDFLRSNSFRVFIVTGGGVEFVRAISDEVYGVPSDDVVGSAVQLTLERRDDTIVLVRQPALLGSPNEGEPKALNIQSHIGRRPILAAGNTAGDREMLEYVTSGSGPSLALVIEHDDDAREYAYPGGSLTDPHAEPVSETAARLGWTTVSMRRDWSTIFDDGKSSE